MTPSSKTSARARNSTERLIDYGLRFQDSSNVAVKLTYLLDAPAKLSAVIAFAIIKVIRRGIQIHVLHNRRTICQRRIHGAKSFGTTAEMTWPLAIRRPRLSPNGTFADIDADAEHVCSSVKPT